MNHLEPNPLGRSAIKDLGKIRDLLEQACERWNCRIEDEPNPMSGSDLLAVPRLHFYQRDFLDDELIGYCNKPILGNVIKAILDAQIKVLTDNDHNAASYERQYGSSNWLEGRWMFCGYAVVMGDGLVTVASPAYTGDQDVNYPVEAAREARPLVTDAVRGIMAVSDAVQFTPDKAGGIRIQFAFADVLEREYPPWERHGKMLKPLIEKARRAAANLIADQYRVNTVEAKLPAADLMRAKKLIANAESATPTITWKSIEKYFGLSKADILTSVEIHARQAVQGDAIDPKLEAEIRMMAEEMEMRPEEIATATGLPEMTVNRILGKKSEKPAE